MLRAVDERKISEVERFLNRDTINNQDELNLALYSAARIGNREIARLLLAGGAEVDSRSGGKYLPTPMHMATDRGHSGVVSLLLQCGANVDYRDGDGWTPLHLAAAGGYFNIISILLENGARIDSKDRHGATPLFKAVSGGKTKMVEFLLKNGAEVHPENRYGRTLLSQAGNSDIVNLLLQYGVKPTEECTKDGETALHRAAKRDPEDKTIKLLCRRLAVGD